MAGLNTAEYDKKGRCVRHPNIRLRKKKIFGGWKISEFVAVLSSFGGDTSRISLSSLRPSLNNE